MKYNKEEILKLHKEGKGIHEIQRLLKISSPSVVHHHIKSIPFKKITLNRLKELLPKPRHPVSESDMLSNYMTAGWNEYHKALLKVINSL